MKIFLTALFALFTGFASAGVTITNLVVAQRPGTKLVDITYDVYSTEGNEVYVLLAVSNGTKKVTATSLTGDVGAGVAVGTGKSMVWNMGTDWSGNVASGVVFAVTVVPVGGDPKATSWLEVNTRWVRNIYSDGAMTMSDKDTGKMWCYSTSAAISTWDTIMSYCDGLTYAGYSDWRLPDLGELQSQYSQKGYFSNVQSSPWYWSSNSDTYSAWQLDMGKNITTFIQKSANGYAWPVRGGQ